MGAWTRVSSGITIYNAARMVCHAPPRAKRSDLFGKLDWLTVNQLIRYHTLLSMFKIRSSREPEYLAHFVGNDNRNERIIVPNTDLSLAKNSFVFRGSDQWNQLPLTLRKSCKIGVFKKALRKWIVDNVSQFLD